ncbi:unnamed protein product [Blepharisma stoltei]|uniref:leucine--tRNA ligase n=1 Tax=Blepharisma stoltei TaxID=1481888 RepID=A0AAU9IXI7_9CILI|nr:unnamed protein product [Blepharisma stoltei]
METAAKNTKRREFLKQVEHEIQDLWENQHVYEAEVDLSKPKYFITFPYPYMNGRLHLGHAFSFSKCEFTARYQRMLGKNVLLPFGLHVTGMPIPACADKLKRELNEEIKEGEKPPQYTALYKMGVPEEEIPKFQDAKHWLTYFPPRAKVDLHQFGAAVDWRRSFITTDMNPYYDSFVRWHFANLIEKDKIKYGKRYTVYSIRDGGPCADHDRQTGEGVDPQEYTLIKIQVLPPYKGRLAELDGKNIFLAAATLRTETMYGQTNCFILPEGNYGAFLMKNDEVFICSERSMKNMAYQGLTQAHGEYTKLLDLKGTEILGLPLKAPLAPFDVVYSLPMMSISMNKGTGVVTSVPSDAPDDYAALRDLKNKPALREKYGITEEMVNYEVVPIIDIPELGTTAAVRLCEELKINSQNDKKLLAEAKSRVYLKGFHEGVMIVGPYAGQKVSVAKPLVRQELIQAGQAAVYYEPESTVMSRSGEECIVALVDQWYLAYGEEQWKTAVQEHVQNHFNTFNSTIHKEFEGALEWLKEWACSRSYGLGTQFPKDPTKVIESLSDSTIYMAFYTISHWLQGGVIDGSVCGPAQIPPEKMTREVWDYIFLKSDTYPEASGISKEILAKLRQEFSYWYPLDLRCSGKDLIRNHLTMSLYNHAAVWDDKPNLWPRAFFCNGHLLLNSEKMSKSTGNFMTIQDCLIRYGADATRIALAEAGDTIEDANFLESTADSAILKLYTLHDWIKDNVEVISTMRTGEKTFFDSLFENELNNTVEKARKFYDKMNFRDLLITSFYDLISSKEDYRIMAGSFHVDLFIRYVEVQVLLMAPITPHFSESNWQFFNEKLNRERGLVINQPFPTQTLPVDPVLLRQGEYIKTTLRNARLGKEKGSKKEGGEPKKAVVYVSVEYPELQRNIIRIMQEIYTRDANAPNSAYINAIKELGLPKAGLQKAMQFASFAYRDYETRGIDAFELTLPFDEKSLLETIEQYAKSELGLEELLIRFSNEAIPEDKSQLRDTAAPGRPQFFFFAFSKEKQSK